MKVAIVENGKVVNVIRSDTLPDGGIDVTGQRVGPGWSFDGDAFAPPPARQITIDYVEKAEFLDLFTFAELVAIETAAETDVQVRIALRYLDAADLIELAGRRLQRIATLLVQKGLLTEARVDEIKAAVRQQ